jgi:uncharacterized membrane protein (DUF4010 family)
MPSVQILSRLLLALAVGALIGLERGWRRRRTREGGRAAGLRTMMLTALFGGVVAALGMGGVLLAAGLLAAGGVLAAFQWRESRRTGDASATGVVAGLLAYALGATAVLGEPVVAAAAGVAATVVLAFKEELHRGVRALTWTELRALLILLVMSGLILPVLPDRAFDPWGALNPRRIWLFAVLVASVSFVGYFCMRLFGRRGGLLLAGLAGGLASSTATTLNFARLTRQHPPLCGWLAAGTLLASGMMGLRVMVLAAAVDRSFAAWLAGPMLGYAAISFAAGAALMRLGPADPEREPNPKLGNPLELSAALKFAALIASVSLAAKLLSATLGRPGVYALAGLSGLADVDALTLSVAGMASHGLGRRAAALAVLIAVGANSLAKTVIAVWIGTLRHGWRVGLPSLAALAGALGIYAVL